MVDINRREFFKKSAKVATTTALIAKEAQSGVIEGIAEKESDSYGFYKKGAWRNWSMQVSAKPKEILKPKGLRELRSIIVNTDTMRFVGSSHSISGIVPTGQSLVNTDLLSGIINLDRQKEEVRVWAGMKLKQFSNELATLGYALSSTGDTFYQSLAGLTSTGTHGTGMQWGSCSDEACMVGMTVMTADGNLTRLHQDNPGDRELLSAFRVGLGALGYVVAITFKVMPIHNIEHHGKTRDLEDALDPKHLEVNDHYEFAYSPYTNQCITFERVKTHKLGSARFDRKRKFRENFLENDLANFILGIGSKFPHLIPEASKMFLKSVKDNHDIGRCDHIMTMARTAPAYLMEYAIPIENTRKAIEAFKEITFELQDKPKEDRFYVNLPCQVRFVRGDRGSLISPGVGRDTCWFGVGSYHKFKNSEKFFKPLEKKLIELGGRPHWGKLFYTNPTGKYENWGKYTELRNKLDPNGKFKNRYIEKLDGLQTQSDFKKGKESFTHF